MKIILFKKLFKNLYYKAYDDQELPKKKLYN